MQVSGSSPNYSIAPSGANQGRYDSNVEALSGLLSMQGAAIFAPDGTLALHAPAGARETNSCTVTVTEPDGAAPVTAANVAQQMIDCLGSHGVITLSAVEKAENGSTSPSANTTLNSNSYNDIAADFAKLSNGTGELTAAQLTNAIQQYMNTQYQRPNGFGSRSISQPA